MASRQQNFFASFGLDPVHHCLVRSADSGVRTSMCAWHRPREQSAAAAVHRCSSTNMIVPKFQMVFAQFPPLRSRCRASLIESLKSQIWLSCGTGLWRWSGLHHLQLVWLCIPGIAKLNPPIWCFQSCGRSSPDRCAEDHEACSYCVRPYYSAGSCVLERPLLPCYT